jgi:hypothetical protein
MNLLVKEFESSSQVTVNKTREVNQSALYTVTSSLFNTTGGKDNPLKTLCQASLSMNPSQCLEDINCRETWTNERSPWMFADEVME